MPTIAKISLLSTLVRRMEAHMHAERRAHAAIAGRPLVQLVEDRRQASATVNSARRALALAPIGVAAGTQAERTAVARALRALEADLLALESERAEACCHVERLLAAARPDEREQAASPFRAAIGG